MDLSSALENELRESFEINEYEKIFETKKHLCIDGIKTGVRNSENH